MLGGSAWDRASDRLARFVGSWEFVLGQATLLVMWFLWNTLLPEWLRFDPYPFILANLFMSAEAAFATPILLMSSNRAAASDRSALHEDLKLDQESLELIKHMAEEVDGLVSRSKKDGTAARERCPGCNCSDAVHSA
jgi:uncharacterized membrane protein